MTATIPRPKGRGLIEGKRRRPKSDRGDPTIPRPKGRGLIEGEVDFGKGFPGYGFRGRKVAASLKVNRLHRRVGHLA